MIAAALAVHRELGPGFLESTYEKALCLELDAIGLPYESQKPIPILYKGVAVGEHRLDLLVAEQLIVELKTVESLDKIYFSIVRSYLKAAALRDALLLNFATMPLTVKRVGVQRDIGIEGSSVHSARFL